MTKEPTKAQVKDAWTRLKDRVESAPPTYVTFSVSIRDVTTVLDGLSQCDAEQEEHEAFRQRVSEFAKRVRYLGLTISEDLRAAAETFIQPAPEPTPAEVLADAVSDVLGSCAALSDEQVAYHIRRILTMRGVELRFKDRSHEG